MVVERVFEDETSGVLLLVEVYTEEGPVLLEEAKPYTCVYTNTYPPNTSPSTRINTIHVPSRALKKYM